jgi:uncharacterized protein YndB with AHSA1/START domain
MSETAADREVLITRIFGAPREQVFRAWTDPDELAEWYGPGHFDTPRDRIRIDLRVGGRYEPTIVRVELHDHGDRTRMTLTDAPYPPAARGNVAAGYEAAFDKLDALLAG